MELKVVEEQAKEELQSLEAQHPNHFDYLKSELKSFISLLQSHHPSLALLDNNTTTISNPTSSSAPTQASCSGKKRKKIASQQQYMLECSNKMQKVDGFLNKKKKKRDRIDIVLERARACLEKIQKLKSGLLF